MRNAERVRNSSMLCGGWKGSTCHNLRHSVCCVVCLQHSPGTGNKYSATSGHAVTVQFT
jgi:hypothetical protein